MTCTDQIIAAFPPLIEGSADFLPSSVTDEELSNLASDICTFYIEDVPPFLGALLYAIAKNPPSDPWQWERLIDYLNVNLESCCFSRSELGCDAADITEEYKRRTERRKEFEQLDPAQIEAVRAWLSMAQGWGFKGAMGEEIREAFDSWKNLGG